MIIFLDAASTVTLGSSGKLGWTVAAAAAAAAGAAAAAAAAALYDVTATSQLHRRLQLRFNDCCKNERVSFMVVSRQTVVARWNFSKSNQERRKTCPSRGLPVISSAVT